MKPEAMELEKQIKVLYFSSTAFPFLAHFHQSHLTKYFLPLNNTIRIPPAILL